MSALKSKMVAIEMPQPREPQQQTFRIGQNARVRGADMAAGRLATVIGAPHVRNDRNTNAINGMHSPAKGIAIEGEGRLRLKSAEWGPPGGKLADRRPSRNPHWRLTPSEYLSAFFILERSDFFLSMEIFQKRADALSAGAETYETGKPCKRGHVSPRNAQNGHCLACQQERNDAQPRITSRRRGVRALSADKDRKRAQWLASYHRHKAANAEARRQREREAAARKAGFASHAEFLAKRDLPMEDFARQQGMLC